MQKEKTKFTQKKILQERKDATGQSAMLTDDIKQSLYNALSKSEEQESKTAKSSILAFVSRFLHELCATTYDPGFAPIMAPSAV